MSSGYAATDESLDVAEPYIETLDARIAKVDTEPGSKLRHFEWLEDAAAQLRAIADLPPGWDGDGSPTPDRDRVNGGFSLLECLAETPGIPKPYINPTRDGGVQFEWEVGPRYFEVEIVALGAAVYFFQDKMARIEEEGEVFVGESLEKLARFIWHITQAA